MKQYVAWQPTQLEQLESLEQLRALWHGEKIHIEPAKEAPQVGWIRRKIWKECEPF